MSSSADNDFEHVLQAMRVEWKNGFNGRVLRQSVQPGIVALRTYAATRQSAEILSGFETELERYDTLPTDGRKTVLVNLADALKLLRDEHTALGTRPPVDTLPAALRTAKVAPAPAIPAPQGVKQLSPDEPVTKLPKIGETVAKKLANLGVETVQDLLELAPRRHIDYTQTAKIGSLMGFGGMNEVTIRGRVTDIQTAFSGGPKRVTIRLEDDTGWVRVTWFNVFIARQLDYGVEIAISGTPDRGFGALSFTNPEWERLGGPGLSTGRVTPVYPLTAGVAQKSMRAFTRAALDATKSTIRELLPDEIRNAEGLLDQVNAYEQLHYPGGPHATEAARRRLGFDELLLLQLWLLQRKRERTAASALRIPANPQLLDAYEAQLPFQFTNAQRRALAEVLQDLAGERPMARLLQGDVGSGKTAVAAAAALMAVAAGQQVAVMAPTEILAEQHNENFQKLYEGLPENRRPSIRLLTGSTNQRIRRELLPAVEAGAVDILVGTHALIEAWVAFKNLGLSIIDEQHRFGVRQRADLPGKAGGHQPHLLSMTATPIPRSLNLVIHGDLEVSVIDELPPGRIPIDTQRFMEEERSSAYRLVREEVKKAHQVFVICPLVEESETSEMKAAVDEAERLRREVFPQFKIEHLHGRMSGKAKDEVMTRFRERKFDILVSTSVIEVGIDIPNATVMIIEGADRFGLAQLHQFRGRVGRGGARSYCLLLADDASPDAEQRLQLMVETNDGFTLAEMDLQLRGPGDSLGTRQSGLPLANWLDRGFDTRVLDTARTYAERILADNPALAKPEHAEIRRRLDRFWQNSDAVAPLPS